MDSGDNALLEDKSIQSDERNKWSQRHPLVLVMAMVVSCVMALGSVVAITCRQRYGGTYTEMDVTTIDLKEGEIC